MFLSSDDDDNYGDSTTPTGVLLVDHEPTKRATAQMQWEDGCKFTLIAAVFGLYHWLLRGSVFFELLVLCTLCVTCCTAMQFLHWDQSRVVPMAWQIWGALSELAKLCTCRLKHQQRQRGPGPGYEGRHTQ
jgi:hypothetical protein